MSPSCLNTFSITRSSWRYIVLTELPFPRQTRSRRCAEWLQCNGSMRSFMHSEWHGDERALSPSNIPFVLRCQRNFKRVCQVESKRNRQTKERLADQSFFTHTVYTDDRNSEAPWYRLLTGHDFQTRVKHLFSFFFFFFVLNLETNATAAQNCVRSTHVSSNHLGR